MRWIALLILIPTLVFAQYKSMSIDPAGNLNNSIPAGMNTAWYRITTNAGTGSTNLWCMSNGVWVVFSQGGSSVSTNDLASTNWVIGYLASYATNVGVGSTNLWAQSNGVWVAFNPGGVSVSTNGLASTNDLISATNGLWITVTNWASLQGWVTQTITNGLPTASITNDLVRTNDTRTLKFTGPVGIGVQPVWPMHTYGTSTQSTDQVYDLHENGVFLDGLTNCGKWLTWGNMGIVDWAAGTFQNETTPPAVGAEFWYLYNNHLQGQPFTVSQGGRVALGGKPDNIMDYHALKSITVANDDLNVGGINSFQQQYRYRITLPTSTNWTWARSVDKGVTYTDSGVTNALTTSVVDIAGGITVQFESAGASDHTAGDSWQFYGWSSLPRATLDVAPSGYHEIGVVNLSGAVTNWVDQSANLNSTENDPVTIFSTTTNYLYISRKVPFNAAFFNTVINGVGVTLVAEYWNGTTWAAINWATNYLQDDTTNLTTFGSVKWEKLTMPDWVPYLPPGKDASYNQYWMRFSSSTLPTTAPTISGIFPQSMQRFAVYSGHRDATPSFWVGTRGNTYAKHVYKTTSTAPALTELVTFSEAKAYTDNAIALTQSTVWYFDSAASTSRPSTRTMTSSVMSTNVTTTITPAVGTNIISIYSVPTPAGTNTINSGQKYQVKCFLRGTGNAGPTFYGMYRIVELGSATTNILYESALSTALSATPTLVDLVITASSNATITATNYLGVEVCVVRVGGNSVSASAYIGASYQSSFTIGGSAALASETDPVWTAAKSGYGALAGTNSWTGPQTFTQTINGTSTNAAIASNIVSGATLPTFTLSGVIVGGGQSITNLGTLYVTNLTVVGTANLTASNSTALGGVPSASFLTTSGGQNVSGTETFSNVTASGIMRIGTTNSAATGLLDVGGMWMPSESVRANSGAFRGDFFIGGEQAATSTNKCRARFTGNANSAIFSANIFFKASDSTTRTFDPTSSGWQLWLRTNPSVANSLDVAYTPPPGSDIGVTQTTVFRVESNGCFNSIGQATFPTGVNAGSTFYHSVSNVMYTWNGSAWKAHW